MPTNELLNPLSLVTLAILSFEQKQTTTILTLFEAQHKDREAVW